MPFFHKKKAKDQSIKDESFNREHLTRFDNLARILIIQLRLHTGQVTRPNNKILYFFFP